MSDLSRAREALLKAAVEYEAATLAETAIHPWSDCPRRFDARVELSVAANAYARAAREEGEKHDKAD